MNEHLSLAGEVQTLVEFSSSAELLSHSTSSSFVYGHHEFCKLKMSKDVIYTQGQSFLFDDTCSNMLTLDTRYIIPAGLADT